MCGRFTLATDLEQIEERFSFHAANRSLTPRYNIAPSQAVFAIIGDEAGNRGGLLRWGLIPSWAKEAAIGNRMINARAETIAEKPSFRRALQKRRCLIVADGFYEWRQEGKKKTPIFIRLASRAPFAFAGLWETWRPPDDEAIHSCTIITTTPNTLMASIHNRMPVILTPEAETVWLDRTSTEPETLLPLLAPYPETEMEAYEVALTVNSPRNDSPACIAPVR
ncbi:MAG: SOS response-associated peptidase [Deltaproteobacteria bacterium]|nr:SOS response-associated peptidase [Deltaproteobacteria bacterium]